MNWRFSGGRPVYLQVMEQIQGAVLAGEYMPGEKIPSVRELATQAKINPNTMQHALQELERVGLLETKGTNGRYVTENREILEQIRKESTKKLTAQYVRAFATYGIDVPRMMELLREYQEGS